MVLGVFGSALYEDARVCAARVERDTGFAAWVYEVRGPRPSVGDRLPEDARPVRMTRTYRGVTYTVGPRTPFPGIGWSIPTYDHLGRRVGEELSQGAFYDDGPDQPDSAYEWADRDCRAYIDRMLDT